MHLTLFIGSIATKVIDVTRATVTKTQNLPMISPSDSLKLKFNIILGYCRLSLVLDVKNYHGQILSLNDHGPYVIMFLSYIEIYSTHVFNF